MEELYKQKEIKKELTKLKKLFLNIPENQKKLTESLVQQCAFMKVTLDELQQLINENGSVEIFQNGSQVMNREYPALKSYNTTVKNYSALMKQLIELLPEQEEKDELSEFLSKRK